jgi:hypothetical protein
MICTETPSPGAPNGKGNAPSFAIGWQIDKTNSNETTCLPRWSRVEVCSMVSKRWLQRASGLGCDFLLCPGAVPRFTPDVKIHQSVVVRLTYFAMYQPYRTLLFSESPPPSCAASDICKGMEGGRPVPRITPCRQRRLPWHDRGKLSSTPGTESGIRTTSESLLESVPCRGTAEPLPR